MKFAPSQVVFSLLAFSNVVGKAEGGRYSGMFLTGTECRRCPTDNTDRRHLLIEDGIAILDNEGWDTYKEKCKNFEFDLVGYVESHFYLVAKPKADAIDGGCETIVFHADDLGKGPIEKQVLKVGSGQVDSLDMSHLATRQFSDLAKTFDQVGVNGAYDLFLNNCADFVWDFLQRLDVTFTSEFLEYLEYAKARLHKHGDSLVQVMKGNTEIIEDDAEYKALIDSLFESVLNRKMAGL
jgi:hypothetical protein